MEIHVHIHNGEVKEGKEYSSEKRRKRGSGKAAPPAKKKRKGKPMSLKTKRAINRGRRAKGLKPIKWKK